MTLEIALTLTVVLGVLVLLSATSLPPDVVLLAAMVGFAASGILTPEQALQGFSNTGVMTVAALYIVVAGVRETGAMAWISQHIFGNPKNVLSAQLRMGTAVAALSSFINNTPVVIVMLPVPRTA